MWLVAKDVCDVLGIVNARDAVSELDDDEKADVAITDGSQIRHYNAVSEPGLYKLTFKSRKEEAKKFTRWVTHEVLPQIRKTGSYTVPENEQPLQELEPLNARIRIAGILQRLALQVTDKNEREIINRESYKYATGSELPEKKSKAKPAAEQHTPRSWTAEQIGKLLKWTGEAVMHRAEDLELTKKARYGWWEGGIWHFTKEGKRKFLDLVASKIVRVKDGFAYYENGFKLINWEFDADAWRP